MEARRLPGWTLCISTLNRRNILKKCLRHAYEQTRPPDEVVIVDASDDFEDARREIEALFGSRPLKYIQAHKRSLPAQRNQGIAAATQEILFLIDDDAFMHPDGAERILELYARDCDQTIAAIAFGDAPLETDTGGVANESRKGLASSPAFLKLRSSLPIARWFAREVLCMSKERIFVRYDVPQDHSGNWQLDKDWLNDVVPEPFIGGYSLTVRRDVAVREPFDGNLLAYAPLEDFDATYRYSRHGRLVKSKTAKVYHVEAAVGRLKRKQVAMLSILNIAYFVRAKSAARKRHTREFYVTAARLHFSWFLKDLLTLRWSFPQFRAFGNGIGYSRRILGYEGADLTEFFETLQKEILAR